VGDERIRDGGMTRALTKDVTAATEAGVEGNARLTAANGVLLTVLLFVEGLTILDIRGLITAHMFIGLLLIGPVLLKLASTAYRFARYYTGRAAYIRRGPPSPLLRVLGPLVVASTVAVIATGAALVWVTPGSGSLLVAAHKASFVCWFIVMAVHVLGHLRESAVGALHELRPEPGDPAGRRRAWRAAALVAALLVGVGVAAAVTPSGSAWSHSTGWGE
jgi:hypothetical protein